MTRSLTQHAPSLAGIRLTGALGQGGMSTVLLGTRGAARDPMAVKVLSAAQAHSQALRTAFANEIRSVAALRHPGIVPILDYGEVSSEEADAHDALAPGAPYLVMPVALGGTSWELQRRMSWPTLRHFATLVLDALGHAHSRGVLHRDLKPSNVLLRDARDLRAGVWLADFGLARRSVDRYPDAVTLAGGGTMGFRAPEQADPAVGPEGPWTDLFALGRMLMQLTGSVKRWPHAPPQAFWAWLSRLVSPEIEARPRFAAEAADALAAMDVNAPTRSVWWRREPPRSALDPSISQAVLDLSEPGFVGRQDERNQLWAALLATRRERRPRLVIIEGPEGIGRSRLARWVADQAHEQGIAESVRAKCRADVEPGLTLGEGLSTLLHLEDAEQNQVDASLAQTLASWSPVDRARLASLIGPHRGQLTNTRTRSKRGEMYLLSRAVVEVSAPRPLVLVLDDVHASPQALRHARAILSLGDAAGSPILVVLTVAREREATQPTLQRALAALEVLPVAKRIQLPALDPASHRSLVRELLGPNHPRTGAVTRRTLGSPSFAVQLCRHLRAKGPQEGQPPLPPALKDVFTQRLGRIVGAISTGERRAALLAAFLGPEVSLPLWREACGHAEVPASERPLELLARAGLITLRQASVRFDSSLVQASLAELATDAERRTLHAACAHATPGHDTAQATHFLAAEQPEAALPPLTRALTLASRLQDFDQAEALAQRWSATVNRLVLTSDDPTRLTGELATTHLIIGRGRFEEARALCLDLAERAAGSEPHLLRAWRLLALTEWRLGNLERYLTLNQDIAARGEGAVLARAQLDLAYGLRAQGERAEARERAEQAQRLFEAAEDEYNAVDAIRLRGKLAAMDAPSEETVSLLQQGRARAEAIGARELAANILADEARALRAIGDLEGAAETCERCVVAMDELGSPDAVVPRISLAFFYNELERFGEAQQLLSAVLRAQREGGAPLYNGFLISCLCRSLAGLGRWGVIEPAWLTEDFSIARVYPEEVLGSLRDSAELAELHGAAFAAEVLWRLHLRAARAAGDDLAAFTSEHKLKSLPACRPEDPTARWAESLRTPTDPLPPPS